MFEIIHVSKSEKESIEARQLVEEHELEECMHELLCDALALLDSPVEKADLYETISRHPKPTDFELTVRLQLMLKGNEKFSVAIDNQPKRLRWVEAHHLSKKLEHQYDDDEFHLWASELLEIWDSSRLLRNDYPAFVYFLITNPDPRSFDPSAAA